ncbi:MAG: tyrosine-type recombinase/integrase [Rubrivivax sp.]
MSDHIELRRHVWFARLTIPEELRAHFGLRRFSQSLKTGDRRRAVELAQPVVALWKAKIRQARGDANAVQAEALRWREALQEARKAGSDEHVEVLESLVVDRAHEKEAEDGERAAQSFASLALGRSPPSGLHFDAWVVSISHLQQKGRDQYQADVKRLIARFAALDDMTPTALRQWASELTKHRQSPVSPASMKRMVSCWRSYWKYLRGQEVVPPDSDPFSLIELPSRGAGKAKSAAKAGWRPFQPADVCKLADAARDSGQGDQQLVVLITLAAYSGARIEELCSLKVTDAGSAALHIADAKTAAGIRDVPIHPAIKGLVRALVKDSEDGYLISGLTFNKYGDRSNAIGKRFGRLKARLGFGEPFVFHSIRKTVVTLLEDAGVSENLAADIVGHEKPRITYGLYSGGASMKTKAAALGKVAYPRRVGSARGK